MSDAQSIAVSSGSWVCQDCVGDPWLREAIADEGRREICAFCSRERRAWRLSRLAALTDALYRRLVSPYEDGDWRFEPQRPVEILETLLDCGPELAAAVLKTLPKDDGLCNGDEGPDLYDPAGEYVLAVQASPKYHYRWREFCTTLVAGSRFFNREAKDLLAEIVAHLPPHAARLVGPGYDITCFYRARGSRQNAETRKILADPEGQFAAPPPDKRWAGRTNAAGIPVLYVACEPETALAELRPAIGQEVVIAPLVLQRSMKLLDLTVLDTPWATEYFNPQLEETVGRQLFLQRLGIELARPWVPGEEGIGYLPTQCVADCLATLHEPPFDGVVYHSAQHQGGKNITLFARALKVGADDVRYPLPATRDRGDMEADRR